MYLKIKHFKAEKQSLLVINVTDEHRNFSDVTADEKWKLGFSFAVELIN